MATRVGIIQFSIILFIPISRMKQGEMDDATRRERHPARNLLWPHARASRWLPPFPTVPNASPRLHAVCRLYSLLCYLGSQRTVSQLTRSCRSRVCLDFIHFSLLAGIQMGAQSAQRIAPLNVATKSADHYGARS